MLGKEIDQKESKAIPVRIHIGQHDGALLDADAEDAAASGNWLLGYTAVGGKTRWEPLDAAVRCLFVEYVHQIDPVSHLGLDDDCLWYFFVTYRSETNPLTSAFPFSPDFT